MTIEPMGAKENCAICLASDFLIVDHDHSTGFIRGKICSQCNGWLGLLEGHPESYYLRTKPGKRAWRKWVSANAERIYAHLCSNTGVKYAHWKRTEKAKRSLKAWEQKRDAVRDHLNTGSGAVTTATSGAGESRANTRSDSQPKTGGSCSQERKAWAKEMVRRARDGWPEPEG